MEIVSACAFILKDIRINQHGKHFIGRKYIYTDHIERLQMVNSRPQQNLAYHILTNVSIPDRNWMG